MINQLTASFYHVFNTKSNKTIPVGAPTELVFYFKKECQFFVGIYILITSKIGFEPMKVLGETSAQFLYPSLSAQSEAAQQKTMFKKTHKQ
ncbi:hypothetical protein FACS189454_00630 [Planctomycetales bacterium]|nr:hypothetical protein FACS189454_00630 [Planctomycetales bacterium]